MDNKTKIYDLILAIFLLLVIVLFRIHWKDDHKKIKRCETQHENLQRRYDSLTSEILYWQIQAGRYEIIFQRLEEQYPEIAKKVTHEIE